MTAAVPAVKLGRQQQEAVPRFVDWLRRFEAGDRSVPPGFTVMGFGGTGKTTLALHLVEAAGLRGWEVAGAALQASAAAKLGEVTGWDCRTLHRWNYKVEARVGGASWFVPHPDSPAKRFRLLVIDEISQVDIQLWNHTVAHGTPVLVLGDPGQLPPVGAEAIASHLRPDVVLTEIHRQAEGNPIIHWSMMVRQGWDIPYGEYRDAGDGAVKLRKLPMADLTEADYRGADAILVARNATRVALNARQRARLGFDRPLPQAGEKVVCRRNQLEWGLVNGFSGTVLEAGQDRGPHSYEATFRVAETGLIVPSRACAKEAIGLPADRPCPAFLARGLSSIAYGYVHTVHGFIGRQAPDVLVVDEYPSRPGRERWLYTALSRGAQTVTLAVP